MEEKNTRLCDKGYQLFCESLCGNIASFRELERLSCFPIPATHSDPDSGSGSSTGSDCSPGTTAYPIGTKVLTHSLASAEYNDLPGIVSGAPVTKSEVVRIPIILELSSQDKRIMALKPENLTVVNVTLDESDATTAGSVFNIDIDAASMSDKLVTKGYYGLISIVNENPAIPTNETKATKALAEFYTHSDLLSTCSHVQYLLGECHEYGISGTLPRNSPKALEWFRRAAASGHAAAQCELGYCYHNGEGVPQDYKEGVKYYRQAADQGYPKACYYMGVANYYGQGIELEPGDTEDFEAAVKWYHQSADQGYAPSQSNLGYCYQVGKGCNLSVEEAEKYFNLAAEQGDVYASAKLNSLKEFKATTAGV